MTDTESLPPLELDDFLGACLMAGLNQIYLGNIAEEHCDVVNDLNSFDPIKTAATFAGLLTYPDIQSNCIRLEALAHLAIVYCHGRQKPNNKPIEKWFKRLGE